MQDKLRNANLNPGIYINVDNLHNMDLFNPQDSFIM